MAGPERDQDVVGPRHECQLRDQVPALAGEADRRQRPFADDHRMDELDRDVPGVRASGRRAAGRDQPTASREALGHPVTDPRELIGVL